MANPLNILLVHLYSNGDCLFATAVARQIKHDYPGCRLSWMIAGFCRDILSGNPYVDEVIAVDEVSKNDIVAFRKLKRRLQNEKKEGKWDELFITHNMDANLSLYDGTIRGMIFRAYPRPVTVPLQPVLVLNDAEKENVRLFAEKNRLKDFKQVILWEYAPQSGQTLLSFDFVKSVAEKITAMPGTAVILSSANRFESTARIIDASSLSVRENAALTHYCTLLIGCSSGITWLSTSSAARFLPMLQLLDPQAYFRNAPSVDFERYGLDASALIEMVDYDEGKIVEVVTAILEKGVPAVKPVYNQHLPVQFNSTRKIVYNLLCYLQFGAVARHYRITTSVYGKHPLFLKEFRKAVFLFPFRLVANKWRKRALRAGS